MQLLPQVAMELIRAFDQELPEADVDAAGQLEEEADPTATGDG